ncbi:class I SAM-dependent methyltransferase [Nocardia sp. NPDC055321]
MSATAHPSELCRARRRLLGAARCRFAEDSLADAVSAGLRQAVLFGTALDTFASHNPYPHLRVFEIATEAEFDVLTGTTGFDRTMPAFLIRLGAPGAAADALPDPSALAAGSEIVVDYLPRPGTSGSALAADARFEVLADLDSHALAARYLHRPLELTGAPEPRVVRARVRAVAPACEVTGP